MRKTPAIVLPISILFVSYSQTGSPSPAFEVASVKPSVAPSFDPVTGDARMGMGGGPGSNRPGQFDAFHMPLATLIQRAYHIKTYQLVGPEWITSECFDVTAKLREGTSREDFDVMFQALLAARFKLAMHHERREVKSYDLSVAKTGAKIREASREPTPSEPVGGPTPPKIELDADGFPVRGSSSTGFLIGRGLRVTEWFVSTMESLAEVLARELNCPVRDATRLTGNYDITLRYVLSPPGTLTSDADSAAMGPTLVDAIKSQLGLTLDRATAQVDVFVIDHAERKPIEN